MLFQAKLQRERIVISEVIRGIVRNRHGRESVLIPDGVVLPELPSTTDG